MAYKDPGSVTYSPAGPSAGRDLLYALGSLNNDSRNRDKEKLELLSIQNQMKRAELSDARSVREFDLRMKQQNVENKRANLEHQWKLEKRSKDQALEDATIDAGLNQFNRNTFYEYEPKKTWGNEVTDISGLKQAITDETLPEIEQYKSADQDFGTYQEFEKIGKDEANKGDKKIIAEKRIEWLKQNRPDDYAELNQTFEQKLAAGIQSAPRDTMEDISNFFTEPWFDSFNKSTLDKTLEGLSKEEDQKINYDDWEQYKSTLAGSVEKEIEASKKFEKKEIEDQAKFVRGFSSYGDEKIRKLMEPEAAETKMKNYIAIRSKQIEKDKLSKVKENAAKKVLVAEVQKMKADYAKLESLAIEMRSADDKRQEEIKQETRETVNKIAIAQAKAESTSVAGIKRDAAKFALDNN